MMMMMGSTEQSEYAMVLCEKHSDSPDSQQREAPDETSPEEDVADGRITPEERQAAHGNHGQLHHLHTKQIHAELLADDSLCHRRTGVVRLVLEAAGMRGRAKARSAHHDKFMDACTEKECQERGLELAESKSGNRRGIDVTKQELGRVERKMRSNQPGG